MRSTIAVLALTFVSACASAPPSHQPGPAEVEQAVRIFYDAVESLDFERISALITQDFEIVDGGRRMDLGEFEAFVAELSERDFPLDFALGRFHTVIAGDVAYTTLDSLNRPMEAPFFETLILRRVNGEWKVDRFHSTPER